MKLTAQKQQLEWPALPRQRSEQHPMVHGARGQQDSRPTVTRENLPDVRDCVIRNRAARRLRGPVAA